MPREDAANRIQVHFEGQALADSLSELEDDVLMIA